MDSMNPFTAWIVRIVDYPLGWILWLPRDLSLLLFAAGTAVLMTLARRVVTNQDRLQRCGQDLQRLKQFMREAQQTQEKTHVQRLRRTIGQIKGMQLAADMRVLVVVLIPVAALAIWATARLDFLAPRVDHDLVIRAHFPLSSIDSLTHLVPASGYELKSPAIQVIQAESDASGCVAQWTLHPTTAANDLPIVIRHRHESAIHHLTVGRATYLPPVQTHPHERLTTTEVLLPRYHPLGIHLKSETIGLAPWMIGYLLLTLLLVPAFKRLLRVF